MCSFQCKYGLEKSYLGRVPCLDSSMWETKEWWDRAGGGIAQMLCPHVMSGTGHRWHAKNSEFQE